jgi:hypothetical protein
VTGYEANKRLVDLANERSERAGMGVAPRWKSGTR